MTNEIKSTFNSYIALNAFFLFFFLVSCQKKETKQQESNVYYTCSMDPQVMEHKPGKCPICKMELSPVKKIIGQKQNELQLSEQQIQLGNIQTITINKATFGDELLLPATLNFDQSKLSSINARVMGRIDKLYFKNLGDYVKKGSPIYDLYSEELNNAKQEFLLILDKKKNLSGGIIDFDQLIQAAKNKLLLWGMSDAQIADLALNKNITPITTFYSNFGGFISELDIKEGDYTMEGGNILKLADLSTLWAEAQVYASQLADLNKNSKAIVQIPDLDNEEINGHITYVNPEINPDTRINLIRVIIPNPALRLKTGMPVYVKLKSPQRQSLSLPIDAVIRDAKGATVWIQQSKNTFKSVMVQTGLESEDRIEIKSGLHVGESVVVSGAYLLQSEYIFKKGSNPMDGMKM